MQVALEQQQQRSYSPTFFFSVWILYHQYLVQLRRKHHLLYFLFLYFVMILKYQVEGGWVIEGQKRWIGNSTFADVLVIFAKNKDTNQING